MPVVVCIAMTTMAFMAAAVSSVVEGQALIHADECFHEDCKIPQCADPKKGKCCYYCPNGRNCQTPSGAIIKEGQRATEDGITCSCFIDYPPETGLGRGDPPTAWCVTATEESPLQGCLMDDDSIVQPGEDWTSPDRCMTCHCDKDTLQPLCDVQDCDDPACVDAIHIDGDCCLICPNGMNCRLDSGEVISLGKILQKNGSFCYCGLSDADTPHLLKGVCSTLTRKAAINEAMKVAMEVAMRAAAR